MKYLIVWNGSLQALADEVNDLTIMGWKPQGGVAYNAERGYMQAMVLDEKGQ